MIVVTLTGPIACGKTRTIEKAKKALEAQGFKCLRDEERHSTHAGRNRFDVVFQSDQTGQTLSFSIGGTGKIGIVRAVVDKAMSDVRAENHAARKCA